MTQPVTDPANGSYTSVGRIPFDIFHAGDPLDADLDGLYQDQPIMSGEEIRWGLVYEVNPDAWTPLEYFRASGVDWQADFFPSNTIPDFNNENPARLLDRNASLISVNTGVRGSVNRARDIGRTAVREAAAILMSCTQLIAGNRARWEGAFCFLSDGSIGSTTTQRTIRVVDVTSDVVRSRVNLLTDSAVMGQMKRSVGLARHWYVRGWEASDTLDRFMNFWLAIASLYEQHRPAGGDRERDGIRRYLIDLTGRTGLSPLVRDDLVRKLIDAYDARNAVFHEGDLRRVGPEDVINLEEAASVCLRQETGLQNAVRPVRSPRSPSGDSERWEVRPPIAELNG